MARRPAYQLARRAAAPVTALPADPLQRRVIEHVAGPLLVVGGPGTGKTSILAEAVAQRIADGVDPEQAVRAIKRRLAERHGIDHATVESEYGSCADAGPGH